MNVTVDELDEVAPKGAQIYARTKTPYSILNKLVEKRLLDKNKGLTDLVGTTIAVDNYKDLRAVDSKIRGGAIGKVVEIEDMYDAPKGGYRAVHYLVESDGYMIEVQLKTKRQKDVNVLSHNPYKKGTLNKQFLLDLTDLANRADKEDAKAIKEFSKLMKDKKAVEKKLDTSFEFGGEIARSYDVNINSGVGTYAKGGEIEIDEDGSNIPSELMEVFSELNEDEDSYKEMERLRLLANEKGYDFDYDLSGQPTEFWKIDSYAKGGFIQKAVENMKDNNTVGAFTKQANRREMTPVDFAKMVLKTPDAYSETTKKRAQFVKNANPELFSFGGEIARGYDVNINSGVGTYAKGGLAKDDLRARRLWDERGYDDKYLNSLSEKELKSLYDTEFFYDTEHYAKGGEVEGYIKSYNKRMDRAFEKMEKEGLEDYYDSFQIVEETGGFKPEEVAGYYYDTYGNKAYDTWKSNTKGKRLSEDDKKVDRILKSEKFAKGGEVELSKKYMPYSYDLEDIAQFSLGSKKMEAMSLQEVYDYSNKLIKKEMKSSDSNYDTALKVVYDEILKDANDKGLYAKGGKTQGYNSRLDESLGERTGAEIDFEQKKKDRRDESKAMEKSMGKRAYSSVRTMDRMAKGGEVSCPNCQTNFFAQGGELMDADTDVEYAKGGKTKAKKWTKFQKWAILDSLGYTYTLRLVSVKTLDDKLTELGVKSHLGSSHAKGGKIGKYSFYVALDKFGLVGAFNSEKDAKAYIKNEVELIYEGMPNERKKERAEARKEYHIITREEAINWKGDVVKNIDKEVGSSYKDYAKGGRSKSRDDMFLSQEKHEQDYSKKRKKKVSYKKRK